MSAILGRINFSGRTVVPEDFHRALSILDDYGPEGSRARLDGPVALGFQRLDISPESAFEDQPLVQGGLCIVADVILDNRDELCERLAIDRSMRAGLPDSYLILSAYRRWGRDCVDALVGDFAFAIWDDERQRLFCARDHIGARPLYYCHYGGAFSLATDRRALLAFSDVPRQIDETRVASYLLWPSEFHEASFFSRMLPLPAGYWLEAGATGLNIQRYWHPEQVADVRYARRDDYAEHCRELLEQVVASRLRTGFPIGSHVSGGLDSSGVALLAGRQLNGGSQALARCYTWAPAVSNAYPLSSHERDERTIIDTLCRREGVECHYGTASGRDLQAFLQRDMAVEGDTDLFEELPVMADAGERSIRIMLSGWGGDESATFTTRGYPSSLLRRGAWWQLLMMARSHGGGLRNWRYVLHYLWQQAMLPNLPDSIYDRYSPFRPSQELERYIAPAFVASVSNPQTRRMRAWREYPGPQRMQAELLLNGHLAARMASWSHWAAPHGVIYRYPLTDKRLLDFTLGLPVELLWQRGRVRGLYRQSLSDLLPSGLAKVDHANEKKRLRVAHEGWRLLAKSLPSGGDKGLCPWLDMATLRRHLNAIPKTMSQKELLKLVCLGRAYRVWQIWCRYGG
ncbi:asparagine synthase (glutamine-hydrolysing) [Franzmannia pantelleriensis]|uniref:asparagine synthase (glutamine-hydrolyzing) n=1 Tax=Franzmannia pantelleriensis TaxID=48727 RepID=A0A1G9ETX1_9GAMM|nr:asparagine synthase-related protein [Halomonas pantelleriensis]SDK79606.1 asparagine synthase (glutamine-hydrolysing) [Halomonas pantelleriensis]